MVPHNPIGFEKAESSSPWALRHKPCPKLAAGVQMLGELTMRVGAWWDGQVLNPVRPTKLESVFRGLTVALIPPNLVFAPFCDKLSFGAPDNRHRQAGSVSCTPDPSHPWDGRCTTAWVCFQCKSRTMQNHASWGVLAHSAFTCQHGLCSLLSGSPAHPKPGQPITHEA